jgi:hypothetical protein
MTDTFPWNITGEAANEWIGNAANYLAVGDAVVQAIVAVGSLIDNSRDQFAQIKSQLAALNQQIGGASYLELLRNLDAMRGRARAIEVDLQLFVQTNDQDIRARLNAQVGQLEADIESLFVDGPSNGFFQKPYSEAFIKGDGLWQSVVPDRPALSDQGTCFEYRPGIPTIMVLIPARVAYELVFNPNYVQKKSLQGFINGPQGWFSRLLDLADSMKQQVRTVPFAPIEIQCTRISHFGRDTTGSSNWQDPVFIPPPGSVSPMGAVDISTGIADINWDYIQFNVFYLRDRLPFHTPNTQPAPCLGKFFTPPPTVQPPTPALEVAAQYADTFRNDSFGAADRLVSKIGWDSVREFAGHLMPLIGEPEPPFP